MIETIERKNKVLGNNEENINIELERTTLEKVESYVYVATERNSKKYAVNKEITRRIQMMECIYETKLYSQILTLLNQNSAISVYC